MRHNLKKHKYHAKPTHRDGMRFDSKAEANYYDKLKDDPEVVVFLRQVPIHLPGGVKYVLDFLVFREDGEVEFIDVKGMDTPLSKAKRRIVEGHKPPITIKIVKG